MADPQTGTDSNASDGEVEGVGSWETIAAVIMLAILCVALGIFAFGLTRYGISH